MIHESLQQSITQIMRESRLVRATPGRAKSKMPIRIISTYAPNNGHWGNQKKAMGRCTTTQQNMQETPHNMGIRCEWATRKQKPRRGRKHVEKEQISRGIIGPYARSQQTEKGEGVEYTEYSEDNARYRWQRGKTEDNKTRQMEEAAGRRIRRELGEGELGEIHDNMDKPRWKHKKTNRIHRDQCETSKYGTNSAKQYTLAWKHESKPAAPCTDDETLLQRSKEIQKPHTCGNWRGE